MLIMTQTWKINSWDIWKFESYIQKWTVTFRINLCPDITWVLHLFHPFLLRNLLIKFIDADI